MNAFSIFYIGAPILIMVGAYLAVRYSERHDHR
jgi:hypothetical protein